MQTSPKVFTKFRTLFPQSPEKLEIFVFPNWNFFPQTFHLDTYNAVPSTLQKNICKTDCETRSISPKTYLKKLFLLENTKSSSQSSCGHVEWCNFNNPARIFATEVQKFSFERPKKSYKILFKKRVFPQMFFCTLRNKFLQPH